MSDLVTRLGELGVLAPLDRHFAAMLGRVVPGTAPEVLLAAALTSRAVAAGHVCIDLARIAATPLLDADEQPIGDVRLPEPAQWTKLVETSPIAGDGRQARPLVLDGTRVYLRRYFDYEQRLAVALARRARIVEEPDTRGLRERLDRLFPSPAIGPDLSRLAAAIAVTRRLTVITGGPGTGKTTAVARLLALLAEHACATRERVPRVLLLAPTGKAAQRLGEAVDASLRGLPVAPEIADALPRTASTLHRALGFLPRTPTRFAHSALSPLPYDVVVVDEASMVDLALFAKLVEAVHADARLILLGDKDQLASVEAGAILGDVCGSDGGRAWSAQLVEQAHGFGCGEIDTAPGPSPALRDCIVELVTSHRYDAQGAIARLARAVNAGDADAALFVLDQGNEARLVEAAGAAAKNRVTAAATSGFTGLFRAVGPAQRLASLGAFRVLCAHRKGRLGAEQLGRDIEDALRDGGLVAAASDHYAGRPVLVTRNDHELALFNGDVGVLDHHDGRLRAWFAAPGQPRAVPIASLPPHETPYAMTVHKSQGSEFDEVLLVLPDEPSPIVTRELLYTAVTRARREVVVVGTREVLRAAISRGVERSSGLGAALWRTPSSA